MTQEELLKVIDELASRGYIKNFSDEELESKLMKTYSGHSTYMYKVITRRDCEYGASRADNVLQYRIWSFEPYKDRVPPKSLYSLEPVVMISRNIDERIDLHIEDYNRRTVDECEEIAKSFGAFCESNIPIKKVE